ncbi:MAG: ATP-binding protein [Treponema sp.]|nr:ATP-binding protein [Treponema sp.]
MDTQTKFTNRHKTRLSFSVKLVLGIATLSLLALVTIFVIVNTMVRGIIYDNVVGVAQRDKDIHAAEIDNWFGTAGKVVSSLSTVLRALPSEEHFATIAEEFVAEYDFIENIFIGFADGRVITGVGWIPPEGWLSTDRPWYIAATAAGEGRLAATEPYLSYSSGNIAVAISTWLPSIGAAVGAAISINSVLERIDEYHVMADGYLILIGEEGCIIAHPTYAPRPGVEMYSLRNIPNGDFLMNNIAAGTRLGVFNDDELGQSYFIAVPLETIGWTLIAVIPTSVTRGPLLRSLALIMFTLAALLVALFMFTMFFVSHLTKSMEERQTSEERLRSIIDNMPLVSNISGRDSSVIECNKEAPRVFGLRDKQEYIERFFELQPRFQPDGRESMEKALAMDSIAFETGQNRFEWMHQSISGEPIPCEVTLVRVEWRGETQLLSFVRDLREFYEAQNVERAINKRIRLMLDVAPLVIEFWDKDCNPVDCNQTTLDFYAFLSKEDHKERWAERLPELQPDGTSTLTEWKRHLTKIFEGGSDSFDFVTKKLAGESVFLEIVGCRTMLNDEPVVVTYSSDVTKLKKTLQRMQEVEERIQLMLDGTPIACYLINKDFEAIDCNKETLNLLDFESKPDGIEKFREIFSKYRFDKLKKHFDKALDIGSQRFEWILQKRNEGGYIPCDIAFIRFTHKGEYVVAAYIFDLRMLKGERQRVETAEEHSKAKSRFLARMSQEIRTPITAILDISEIQLQNPPLPPNTEAAFAKIQSSADMLLKIVNDILDLSQIEAGSMTLMHEEYEVAGMISDVVQTHLMYLGSKKIEFRMQLDEKIPAFLTGDEIRIKQLVNNLLSNAFKYTVSGWVELTLQSQNITEGYVTLVIGIRDTGQGMTPEQIDELYSEYTRFNEREKRSIKGTGLGMPIVYSLVQMMDAQIKVESEAGKGTNIVVRIPQKIAGQGVLGKETAAYILRFAGGISQKNSPA